MEFNIGTLMQKLVNFWNQDFCGIVFSWDDVPSWVGLSMLSCCTHSFASDIASVFLVVTWTQFRSSSTYRSGLHHIRGRHSYVKTYTPIAPRNTKVIDGVSVQAFIWLHLTFSLTQQLWSLRLENIWFPATLTWTLTCNKQQ